MGGNLLVTDICDELCNVGFELGTSSSFMALQIIGCSFVVSSELKKHCFKCFVRLPLFENPSLHKGHSNDLSPVGVLLCSFKTEETYFLLELDSICNVKEDVIGSDSVVTDICDGLCTSNPTLGTLSSIVVAASSE